MEEFQKRVESELVHPNLPQFKTKEEIIENARARLAAKRDRTTTGSVQGTAGSSGGTESAIRRYQGNGRSNPDDRIRANTEGRPQTYPVHAGDGRDAPGAGSVDGHSNNASISDRVDADSGTRPYQYDGSAGGVSERQIYAAPGARKKRSARSVVGDAVKGVKRVKDSAQGFYEKAFAPMQPEVVTTKRGSKAPPAAPGKRWRPLSGEEANTLRPKLIEYITWQSEHLDQFIIATTKGHDPTIEIWSDLTDEEIEVLADYLISRGRSDGTTAQAIRYAATILDRIKVAIIVLPRVYRTVNIYLARGLDIQIFVRPG